MEESDLESLVERFYPRIYRAALVMTGDAWDADDLAQETFLQAISSWRRFSGRSRVDTWLYSILLNQQRHRLRARQRRERRWRHWLAIARKKPANDPPDRPLQLQEWQRSLWSCVAELPNSQRHAIVLRYSEGLAYEQIAQVLDCPIGTVKSRLHHGLTALKRKLAADDLTIFAGGQSKGISASCTSISSVQEQRHD